MREFREKPKPDPYEVRKMLAIAESRSKACSEMNGCECPECGTNQIMYRDHDDKKISCRCRRCRTFFVLERNK